MDHLRKRVESRCGGIAQDRCGGIARGDCGHPPCIHEQAVRTVVLDLPERDLQRVGVLVLDGRVEKGPRRGAVAARDCLAQRAPRGIPGPFSARESRAPAGQPLLVLRVDDRSHTRTGLRVARHVGERRREGLTRAGGVEHHRAKEWHERAGVAEHRECPPADEGRSPVGRGRLHPFERCLCARSIAPEQARFRAPHGNVRGAFGRDSHRCTQPASRADWRRPLDPQLCAGSVSLSEVEVGEPDERVDPRVAPGLRDGQGAHEGITDLLERGSGRLTSARESHPDLRARRRATCQLLEGQRELCVEVRRFARVGEKGEPERRVGRLREHAMGGRACCHPVARGEGFLSCAQVFVRARKDNLDLAQEGRDDVSEAHGSPA